MAAAGRSDDAHSNGVWFEEFKDRATRPLPDHVRARHSARVTFSRFDVDCFALQESVFVFFVADTALKRVCGQAHRDIHVEPFVSDWPGAGVLPIAVILAGVCSPNYRCPFKTSVGRLTKLIIGILVDPESQLADDRNRTRVVGLRPATEIETDIDPVSNIWPKLHRVLQDTRKRST